MLKVEPIGEQEWSFVYSPKYDQLMDRFGEGVELWRRGQDKFAEKIYKEVIGEYPEFIDAYHHLGLLYEALDKDELAFENWMKGYQIGRRTLPPGFILGRDLLRWGCLENRPFLRCAHAFGLCFFDRGNLAKSIEIFEFIILVNPNDNQGIRALLVDGYLKIGGYMAALGICDKYQGDFMVNLLYGKPYALFKMGDREKVTSLLREAIRLSPKVARELLKKRHSQPKSLDPGRYTIGGDDEGFYYWEENGILWKDPEVESWLIRNAKKRKK